MNINQNINRLLYVLQKKGKIYKINSFQFYSEKKDKYITKYQVQKRNIYEKYDIEEECYSKVDVLKYFMKEYGKM